MSVKLNVSGFAKRDMVPFTNPVTNYGNYGSSLGQPVLTSTDTETLVLVLSCLREREEETPTNGAQPSNYTWWCER